MTEKIYSFINFYLEGRKWKFDTKDKMYLTK